MEVLTPGLSVSKPSQGAESDGTADTTINDDDDEDDHTQLNQSQPRNQKLEQLKNITRRSRGFQSRSCHDPVSASSSASTSRASSPHDSDGSGSSSTYCTSPTGTRSTISSSASSSSGRSSFGDDSAPPAINDVPASAGGHIISPIVRTSSSCNSGNNAAHDHGPTATQKCCSSASARVAGSIGVKSSRSGQPPVSSSLATNGGLQTAEVTGISATIVESASLTDGREISGGGHDRLVSTGAVRSNREGGASRKECGTRRGQVCGKREERERYRRIFALVRYSGLVYVHSLSDVEPVHNATTSGLLPPLVYCILFIFPTTWKWPGNHNLAGQGEKGPWATPWPRLR